MRLLFVHVVNKGTEIYVKTKRGTWVHRATSDATWQGYTSQDQARAELPECPPWATNVRVACHRFYGGRS